MFETQAGLPDNFDGKVKLFPLPNLVLFPGNIQPLHIFESRYREMFEDALAGDQLIAMATLLPGFENEYHSRPGIDEAVCIGRIVRHRKREDGTYDLLLAGLSRAIIREELPPVHAYREATVRVIEETLESPSQQGEIGKQLLDRFRVIAPEAGKLLDAFDSGELTMSHFVDVMAFSYPFELELELRLLAEPSATERARMMLDNLPTESTSTGQPPPFSMN